jgi:hypothetical protein
MVEYMNAIKKPFTDMKTLGIGTILFTIIVVLSLFSQIGLFAGMFGAILGQFELSSIIALFSGIGLILAIILGVFVFGYFVNLLRVTLNGNKEMPKWEFNKIGKYIIDSLKIAFIYLVYSIPMYVLFFLQIILSSMGIDLFGIPVLFGFFLGIIAVIFLPMAICFSVKENNIMSAFKFGAILKKVLTAKFWISIIVLIGYTLGMLVLLSILMFILTITIVGLLLTPVLYGVLVFAIESTTLTVLAEVFNETP